MPRIFLLGMNFQIQWVCGLSKPKAAMRTSTRRVQTWKVLADQAGFRMRRRCLKLPRCRGDAVRRVGVSTQRGLLVVSASIGFDGWEYLWQVLDAFGRRGNTGYWLVVIADAAY